MKRILIFSLAYFPHVGGAEIALKEITDRISQDDIAFDMVTLRFNASSPAVEQIGNVRVYRVGIGGSYVAKVLFPIVASVRAHRLNRTQHYDGFWAMMSYMVFPIVLLRLFRVRVPYVLTLQEGDPFKYVFKRWYIRLVQPLLSIGFRNAAVVQVISNFLGAWARRMRFVGPLEIVPNGVNVRRFAGDAIPHEGVVLITASRLVHKNAIDDVIRALPLLPEVQFRIFGVGNDEAMLRTLAHECGVADRVVFAGYIDHVQLPTELHRADIFIRPSRSEGMGNSFVEAMAAGLPVIATQEGGIADFLFDAKRNPEKPTTGWAVDANSPEQIATAVKDILGNPERVGGVIETAKAMVLEKYDWDTVAQTMRREVFGKVL